MVTKSFYEWIKTFATPFMIIHQHDCKSGESGKIKLLIDTK